MPLRDAGGAKVAQEDPMPTRTLSLVVTFALSAGLPCFRSHDFLQLRLPPGKAGFGISLPTQFAPMARAAALIEHGPWLRKWIRSYDPSLSDPQVLLVECLTPLDQSPHTSLLALPLHRAQTTHRPCCRLITMPPPHTTHVATAHP